MRIVLIEAAERVLVSDDDDDDGQTKRIAVEVAHGVFQIVIHQLHEKPVARGNEPHFGGEKLQRDNGTHTGETGEQHPTEIDEYRNGDRMFQEFSFDPQVVENAGKKHHGEGNHKRLRGQREPQMDVFAAENHRKRGAEGHEIHGPIGMEKDKIKSDQCYCNQLNDRKFSDYGVAVGQHKRHRDQKGDNLAPIDLANLL